MKRLIVSIKSSGEFLNDFKVAFKKAEKGLIKEPHYEISFDNKKSFDRFIRHLPVVSAISIYKPKSVYELAKISGIDVSNLNKIILFLEEMSVIKIKTRKVSGRIIKTPIVDYDRIEFKLAG